MLFQKDVFICKGVSFSGIILYLVVAEADYTNAPKNENITMCVQNTEELYKTKTELNGYFKFPCPHREKLKQTLINCLNSTHFYPKPLNFSEN